MNLRSVPQEVRSALQRVKVICFDFDGVFTDNAVYVDQEGREMVRCSRSDGLGLQKLRNIGLVMAVISTEANPVVSKRCEKLKLDCYQGVDDKLSQTQEYAGRHGADLGEVCFVGNDINDLACMEKVGVAIAVADAWPEVMAVAHLVMSRKGGDGVVREICELVAELQGKES